MKIIIKKYVQTHIYYLTFNTRKAKNKRKK